MARFIIHGGHPLKGCFNPAGNKNAALPMLAASLLTNDTLVLKNVPLIEDVFTMCGILEQLGVDIHRRGHTLKLNSKNSTSAHLDKQLCHKVRSSVFFASVLPVRGKNITLYPPGGDIIGRRRLDTHFAALNQLGINIQIKHNYYKIKKEKLRGASILLNETSVTATENVMLAGVMAEGITEIFNAACEPHIQDLGLLLNKMGARISGLGTNRLRIEGVTSLHGASHKIQPDHTEAGSILIASALTGGNITVEAENYDAYLPIINSFGTIGINLKIETSNIKAAGDNNLYIKNFIDNNIPVIDDGPWPNFPSDLMSVAIVAGTQAHGTILFFEKMFESRMYFVDNLINMGARIVQCDPHRILVTGPSPLKAMHVTSPDIRAGMAMLIAALCAKGTSVIDNVEVIDRGYENIDQRLRKLGADIIRRNN
jgi:UDP-N-acetylglucosamine 1-carboxyvinyltransferase